MMKNLFSAITLAAVLMCMTTFAGADTKASTVRPITPTQTFEIKQQALDVTPNVTPEMIAGPLTPQPCPPGPTFVPRQDPLKIHTKLNDFCIWIPAGNGGFICIPVTTGGCSKG